MDNQTTSRPKVATTHGAIAGARLGNVSVFRGVPYARTPVGAARFAAPESPAAWTGVRDAGDIAVATAPAPPRDRIGGLDMTALSGRPWRPPAEPADYLTATVWTQTVTSEPGSDPLHPVLVFLHGGGFLAGAGSAEAYDGTAFARDGIVVVNLNYRLGAAGWLLLNSAPDNRGLLDVLAGLRWVRDNAAAFGGDADQVTVMGQSAGATIVAALLASPAAAGLFQRAISQSGNALGAFTRPQAEKVTAALAAALGISATTAAFADVTDEALLAAVQAITGLDLDVDETADPMLGLSPFSLVLDPVHLPAQPATAVAAGSASGVDLLVGDNADEANLYLVPTARTGAVDPQKMSRKLFGNGTEALTTAHSAARGGGGRTFRYRFDWRSDAFDGTLGASHCMELPFVFGTTDRPSLSGDRSLLGSAPGVAGVTEEVHTAWIAFIRGGNPGWPATTPDTPYMRSLGGRPRRAAVVPVGWAPASVPLSPAIRAGDQVFVSGQVPVDPRSGAVGTSVEAQADQVFLNLATVLRTAGASLDDVNVLRIYLSGFDDFAAVNTACRRWLQAPYPARTTICTPLPNGWLIEIDATAVTGAAIDPVDGDAAAIAELTCGCRASSSPICR